MAFTKDSWPTQSINLTVPDASSLSTFFSSPGGTCCVSLSEHMPGEAAARTREEHRNEDCEIARVAPINGRPTWHGDNRLAYF
jgi:hypothetical protein